MERNIKVSVKMEERGNDCREGGGKNRYERRGTRQNGIKRKMKRKP